MSFCTSRAALLSLAVAGLAVLSLPAPAQAQRPDAAEILFLKIPTVQGASRFDQLATEAPSSVTVITMDEIRRQGWRTLAEIVGNVRGYFTTFDRAYTYVASRGFGRPGDFSNRVLLEVDGQSVNESIYGGGAYGTESMVDVDDIERVEFIRGPGSSLYGAGAFFGVINVITRRGRDLAGGRARLVAGSFGTTAAQASYGRRLDNGLEFLVSGQHYRQQGQQLFYPEFDTPESHGGVAQYDHDQRDHLLAKVGSGDFSIEALYNTRTKQVPTASYGTLFNSPRSSVRDAEGFLAASWDHKSPAGSRVAASVGVHTYSYSGGFPQADGFYGDASAGRWLSADLFALQPIGLHHKLMFGSEYKLSLRQQQTSWGVEDPSADFANDTRTDIWALFAQDEFRLGHLIINAGARLDHYETFGATVSPRAALVYGWGSGAAKLLYGRAFRAPSNFERYYADGYSTKASPNLDPEHIVTLEAILEQRISRQVRGTLNFYQYRATDLITQVKDSVDGLLAYGNVEQVLGVGVEAEVEFEFPGLQGRVSYALQRAETIATDAVLTNSPAHLVQLAVSRGLFRDHLLAGFSLQAMSARRLTSGGRTPGFALANLTLRASRVLGGLGGTLGVYNLWNTRFSDPVGEEHLQLSMPQDRRQFRLGLTLEF